MTRTRGIALIAAVFVLSTARAASSQDTHLLVVAGLGGEPQYVENFYKWGAAFVDAARERYGVPKANIAFLTEKVERDPSRITARATRDGIARAIGDVARRAGANDQVLILLIGHGSFEANESKLNLPGPDISATELAAQLGAIKARVAIVNAASASGGFIQPLSAKGRVVVTATKSGGERNETLFGRYFVDAFTGQGADLDKDNRISLLEAFEFARKEVAREYQQGNRMQTEHALLDDDGDGKGSGEPGSAGGEGSLARSFVLGSTAAKAAAPPAGASARLRALYEEKRVLEERIEALKGAKARMDAARYEKELEELLVQLAEKNQAIRRATDHD